MQPFLNYNFPGGTYLTTAPVITAAWKADSHERWTVPLGGGIGDIFHVGKLPVNTQASAYCNVAHPNNGANWQLRLQVQLMFPKQPRGVAGTFVLLNQIVLQSAGDPRAAGRHMGSAMTRPHGLVVLGCAILPVPAGCATRPVKPPIEHADHAGGYRFETREQYRRDHDNLVVLAFSGGGTRAAAFSYGVLEALRGIELDGPGRTPTNGLDEIGIVTGVSGGSFTALAFGLHGDRRFAEYERRFLQRDVEGELLRRLAKPIYWGSLSQSDWGRTARSFLPNCVNFQTVGNRILVPRPYAPRMKSEDVAEVIKGAFATNKIKTKLPEMTAQYFRRRVLLNTIAWINSDLDWRFNSVRDHVAKLFRDGFPKATRTAEGARQIRVANAGSSSSDGKLELGWQRSTIPDGTVDLFEAAILVQLEPVGAAPRFVDSWHYHVHGGQIHCGTNVLRKPRRKA